MHAKWQPDIRRDQRAHAGKSLWSDTDYRVRAPIDLHIATNEIVAITHSFPEPVTRHNHLQIRVRPAFLSVVKPAHERPNTHKREEIFRSQEGEAPPDIVVAADTDDGEFICGEIGKYFAPILTQLAIFSVRELTIIMARILPRSENSDYFIGSQRHHWP